MQTGFGMLEAGSVSYKNMANIMVKNVVDVTIGERLSSCTRNNRAQQAASPTGRSATRWRSAAMAMRFLAAQRHFYSTPTRARAMYIMCFRFEAQLSLQHNQTLV